MPGILDTWNGRDMAKAVAFLLDQRARLPAGRPWSIAELGLTDADHAKLLAWATSRDRDNAAKHVASPCPMPLPAPRSLDVLRGDEGYGLLLIALFSEVVARRGTTLRVWPPIVDELGDCPLRHALFTTTGVATQPVKDAFGAATARFELRSPDLLQVGEHRWAGLLLLQAGVPTADAVQVGRWIDHAQTRTFLIDALIADSQAFQTAWGALAALRAGTGTRDRANRAIGRCRLLRAPADDLIRGALTAAEADAPAAPAAEGDELELEVRVAWMPASPPAVVIEPRLAPTDAWERRVELHVDGKRAAVYRRNDTGAFARFGNLDGSAPLATGWEVTLHDASGCLAATSVTLLGVDDAIATFDGNGRSCRATHGGVALVVTREPVRATNAGRVEWLEGVGLGVAEVGPTTTVATRDGFTLWPPPAVAAGAPTLAEIEPEDVTCGPERGDVHVRIRHDANVRVIRAFVGPSELRAEPAFAGLGETFLGGRVAPSALTPELRLRVSAERGGQLFQRTLRFRAFTAAAIEGAWIHEHSTVEASLLAGGALRVSLGPELAGHDARIVASGVSTDMPVDAARPPRVRVLGYGEPLILSAAPLWSKPVPPETLPKTAIAERVVDHGAVVGHLFSAGELRFEHRLAREPSDDHWLLVWPRHGAPYHVGGLAAHGGPEDHVVTAVLRDAEPPRAVALCFGKAVLGASWADDWSEGLGRSGLTVEDVLRLVRVLYLPILASPHREQVVDWLRATHRTRALELLAETTLEPWTLEVAAETGEASLVPSRDPGRFRCVARALGLRLRVEGGAVGEWLRGFEARLPVRPVLQPGEAVDEEQQARLREWNGAHLGAFDALLAASSAIHPLDALQRVPPGRRRVYRANWAADVVCGIRISDVSTADQRALLALRRRRREALALHAGRAKEARAEIVGRTSAWAAQPDGAIDAGLETALVDERIIPWLQVELLDRNAQ